MFRNKKVFKGIDYGIVLSVVLICIIGIISIGSAFNVFTPDVASNPRNFIMQIAWFFVASTVATLLLFIDYNTIGGYYRVIYGFCIFLLVLVLIIGTGEDKGSKSWLGIGPFGGQPSELAKLGTVIALAKIMEGMENINTWKNLLKIAVVVLIPMALIQKQPDTGTNIMFAATIFGMLFVAGLDRKIIMGGFGALTAVCLAIWELGVLSGYQKYRILVFLNPELDKLGKGYNAILAKMAIGSGMFFGKGLKDGGLTQGKFIPESHTDFIFSVYAEKFGFIGSAILLLTYFNLIYRGYKIAVRSKDNFGKYMVIGILSMFSFQILQNIGMDIGLMPITGIPLPFVSYGGSSLLTNIIAVSLILNVGMRKKKINF